jgi:hypothetical protein
MKRSVWLRTALSGACTIAFLGCSAEVLPLTSDAGMGGDGGSTKDGAAEATPGCAVSGVDHTTCYPLGDLGTTARSGNVPGQRMQNFSFIGYPAAMGQPLVTKGGTTTVHLSDFFDPAAKKFAIVVLAVVATWSGASNTLSDDLVSRAAAYGPMKAVFVQVLQQGSNKKVGAKTKDLDLWVSDHALNQTAVLDPAGLLGFDTFPALVVLDARSMEILYSATGAPASVPALLDEYLNLVGSIPAKP